MPRTPPSPPLPVCADLIAWPKDSNGDIRKICCRQTGHTSLAVEVVKMLELLVCYLPRERREKSEGGGGGNTMRGE